MTTERQLNDNWRQLITTKRQFGNVGMLKRGFPQSAHKETIPKYRAAVAKHHEVAIEYQDAVIDCQEAVVEFQDAVAD